MADRVRRVRLWRLRRNPLKRRCDVVETVALLVVWLLATACAVAVGAWTFQGTSETLATQRETRHRAEAVLLRDTSKTASSEVELGRAETTGTVRWQEPDGSSRTATVRLESSGEAGDTVTVWLDEAGDPALPPPGPTEAAAQAGAAATLAAAGCGGVALVVGRRIVRARMESVRADYWERAWERVEPGWAGRSG